MTSAGSRRQAQGRGRVVEEDGRADRVRADWWSDALVRQVATRHPAPVVEVYSTAPAPKGKKTGTGGEPRAASGSGVWAAPATRHTTSGQPPARNPREGSSAA